MDINSFLKGKKCECGKNHTCDIKYVYIEDGAIQRLKDICAPYKKILIVADQNTYNVSGEKVSAVLGEKVFFKTVFSGKTLLIPNESAIERVESDLKDADLIVGIGSGVIQDLCKYVSFDKKVPYIIVATAPSMDGYASTGAAMITDGMKVTYSVGLPLAIIADVNVLKEAPMEMIKAGYGDIIGKYSSLNDWKLSALVNGEYICDYIYNGTFDMVKKTMSVAQGIINRDRESVKILMEALVVVGIMISFAGSSRPASGSEHHLSHFFEITGIVKGQEYFPHGIDVAYSTVITAQIREKLLNQAFDGVQYIQEKEQKENDLNRVYGSVASGCIKLQEKLGTYSKNRAIIYKEKQQEIKKVLKEMPSAQQILDILSPVGYDINEFYSFYGEQKINDAIRYAKDLKDRYTVLWMNYDINGGQL